LPLALDMISQKGRLKEGLGGLIDLEFETFSLKFKKSKIKVLAIF